MRFASLFSGCGGFDLGFIEKGFIPCGAFDNDPEAISNFSDNVGHVDCADLTEGIPGSHSLADIDVLIAGPPCQGFSTAGKRLVDDERNHLLSLTGELAQQISPKVLIVENVSGALSGEHARYFDALNETMRAVGYRTHVMRCQATELGMAQLRRRVLFFAWNTGREIEFEINSSAPGRLKDVLRGACKQANHKPVLLEEGSRDWKIATKIKPGQKLSNVRGGENSVATWDIPDVFGKITADERTILELLRRLRRQKRKRDHGDADPVSFQRLELALGTPFQQHIGNLLKKGYLRKVGGDVDLAGTFNGKFRRLKWDNPSHTVDTRFGAPRYFLHPSKNRGFTVREAARIQGFPDSYVFKGSEKAQFRVIGNAVPPPLGAHAAKFARQLLDGVA